jgi:PAS domain S-box-containing protein
LPSSGSSPARISPRTSRPGRWLAWRSESQCRGCTRAPASSGSASCPRIAGAASLSPARSEDVSWASNDDQGRFIEVNDTSLEFFGVERKDLLGQTLIGYTHPDDRPPAAEQIRKVVVGEVDSWRWESLFLRKDGEERWGDVAAVREAAEARWRGPDRDNLVGARAARDPGTSPRCRW